MTSGMASPTDTALPASTNGAERETRLKEFQEEADDIEAFDSAMADEGANIPWEQVQIELGWK